MKQKMLLEYLITVAGGQLALSKALGVSQVAVHYWVHRDKCLPPSRLPKAVKWLKRLGAGHARVADRLEKAFETKYGVKLA